MFYDLNIPWTTNHAELQHTLSFVAELGYNVVALNHTIDGKLPALINDPIPKPLPFSVPSSLSVLHRCTIHISDPSQNARLNALGSHCDILAVRPTDEKSLAQACQTLECDIISLDLTTRFFFYFKSKTLSQAIQRGVKFEICYAPGVLASDGQARKNLISNATQLIRATRGKGLVISSEGHRALSMRAPWDVINLACLWGLGQERGVEAVSREARSVTVQARMKRTGYRGVIDVVYGGEKPAPAAESVAETGKDQGAKRKRKAIALDDGAEESKEKPLSKREKKRRANKARQETAQKESVQDIKETKESCGKEVLKEHTLQGPNLDQKQESVS
ncbi:MAG: hypothetical protein Q9191_002110 [Dirinaria sp. TL-2023a]